MSERLLAFCLRVLSIVIAFIGFFAGENMILEIAAVLLLAEVKDLRTDIREHRL